MVSGFTVARLDELTFHASPALAQMYKLSPFVWRRDGRFALLLRVVNRSDRPSEKVARIHYGTSDDGLAFVLDDRPVIAPSPEPGAPDHGGCEDPTRARVDDMDYVYYSGWNEDAKRGELMLAAGPEIRTLHKRGIALASSANARNPKEATIVALADGSWRLFFEYAHDERSKIGIARSDDIGGPWEVLTPLFDARTDAWDGWHLSTGPVVDSQSNAPLMFYNGATRDAHWRVGWITFDGAYTRVLARCEHPLELPLARRNADDTDIAFAASAVEIDGAVHLYYSAADQYVSRAILQPS